MSTSTAQRAQKPMPKPYSYDLRQKVIQAIKLDGLKKSEASQLLSRTLCGSFIDPIAGNGSCVGAVTISSN